MLLFKSILLPLAAVPAALGHALQRDLSWLNNVCGTSAAGISKKSVQDSAMFLEEYRRSGNFTKRQTQGLTIPLHVHVIAMSETEADGYIPQSKVNEQVQVLQSGFTGTGITFNHVNTYYHVEPWLVDYPIVNDPQVDQLKVQYHVGDYRTLNLWIVINMSGSGLCPLPQQKAGTADYVKLSGCAVNTNSLPGGSHPVFNMGISAVHEVGHWFGLWHVFEGYDLDGCQGVGDEVSDTPAMFGPWPYCDTEEDSCPELDGVDPLSNYMGYTSDACRNKFTTGQAERMFMIWDTYKANA